MEEKLLQELIEYAGDDYLAEQQPFFRRLIKDALDEVICEMYPHGFSSESEAAVKEKAYRRYGSKIRRIAEYHYDKQGREGVIAWSESGASVSYESSGTPECYLRGIIPVARIV